MRRWRFLALALFSTAAACDGQPPPAEEPPPDPIAAEDFANAYANAYCDRAARCFLLADHLADQCRSDVLDLYGDDIVKGAAAGRLEYDEELAGRCVAGIAATGCLQDHFDDETQSACFGALKGTVQEGDACQALFECAAGSCGGEMSTTCPSTCPTVLKEGDACSLLTGPSCDERAGIRCSGGVCVRPAGEGAACIDGNGCQSGLVCFEDKCSPLREVGEGCAADASCEEGLYCVAEGDEGGICELRLRQGAACGTTLQSINAAFKGTQCADGLSCRGAGLLEDGTVVPGICMPASSLGGECLTEPAGLQIQLSGCLVGLICQDGKCALPPSEGQCAPHAVCQHDIAYCDDASTTCMPLRADGDACAIPVECESGACEGGACVPLAVYCHEG